MNNAEFKVTETERKFTEERESLVKTINDLQTELCKCQGERGSLERQVERMIVEAEQLRVEAE